MKRSFLAALFLLVLVAVAPADPSLVYRHDALFVELRRLALAAAVAPPSLVSPITIDEARTVLSRIDPGTLPAAARDEYIGLRAILGAPGFSPGYTIGAQATAELYVHTSGEPDEWRLWYPDRAPLLSIPLAVRPLEWLAIDFRLDFRKTYPFFPGTTLETVEPEPLSNIPGDVRETDVQFPFQAVTSVGGRGWSAVFGRERIAVGSGLGGSLLQSDHVDYHDFLLASLFGRLASYRALYLDLEAWTSSTATAPDRMFFVHRIELRPTRWLSLAANDGFIFADKPIELRYLNPLMLMHNWFVPAYGNSIFTFELAARPVRGLELYAHLAVDQFQGGVERERGYASGEPNAFGYLAGAEYVLPIEAGWLTLATEWVYLDPWMYAGRTDLTSFTWRRRVQAENVLPAGAKVLVEKSLGYPEGPDFAEAALLAGADLFGWLDLAAEVSFAGRGEQPIGRETPADDEQDAARITPSGAAPEFILAGRLAADAVLARMPIGGLREGTARDGRAHGPQVLEVRAGGVIDILRVANDDFVAGATLLDLQVVPFVSVSLVR